MIGETLTTALMQKALDGTWQRQKAISNNIANHETPGYKAVRVGFEEALKKEISRGSKAVKDVGIEIYTQNIGSERADGNNVNLEAENIRMVKTQIQYQYLTRVMTDMYARLRYAISEGKR